MTSLPGTDPNNGALPQVQGPQQGYVQTQSAAPTIPGVQIITGRSNTAPIILVIAPEKAGKSAVSITTTVGYPDAGKEPLVLAWDKTGPDACIKLGYQPHAIKIGDQPGLRNWDKAKGVLDNLERNLMALRQRYGVIITDCCSTMVDRLHEDAARFSPNPNPQSHYGDALMQSKQWINRVVDLGLPSIWLAWLKQPDTVEEKQPNGTKKKIFRMGGPNVLGGTRDLIAGKAHHILYLEKVKVGVGQPGADEDGYLRVFHTRPYDNINSHGRYSHLLPEPIAPAHLGYVLSCITGQGPWAQPQPQAQQQGAMR